MISLEVQQVEIGARRNSSGSQRIRRQYPGPVSPPLQSESPQTGIAGITVPESGQPAHHHSNAGASQLLQMVGSAPSIQFVDRVGNDNNLNVRGLFSLP